MTINSVNTNMGAMIALQSLNKTNSDLAATEKRISTGQRVADSTDDGAAYSVAQQVRSTIGSLGAANQQLGNVQGLLSTTQSGLNDVSNTMASMREVLVKLSDTNVSGTQRTNYTSQFASLLANVKTFIQDSNYNGKSLIGNVGLNSAGTQNVASTVNVVRNETGATYGIASFSGSVVYTSLNAIAGAAVSGSITAANAQGAISTAGAFMAKMNLVNGELNTIGSATNYVTNQVKFNSDKIDSLNTGLGSLVDADLAKESAQLQALQIRQQLGTQALSLANQAPQTLLSLFK
jgi:flagellin